MRSVRTLFRPALAAVAALLLAACATGPKVSTDGDPQADYSRYRTFAFFEPLAVESRGYSTLLSDRLKSEARRQMELRGFVYDAAAPDLQINLNAFVEEKTQVVTTPYVDYGYYYNYRARAYIGVPVFHDRTHVNRYTEGTINVDLVDAREKRLIWEGVAVGSAAGRSPADRRDRAVASVAKIFESFPHRAGGAATTTP